MNSKKGFRDQEKSISFDVSFHGINRIPVFQPLPKDIPNYSAILTLRLEVTPQGKVIDIVPVQKSGNPKVDQIFIDKLKKWRFSNLPEIIPRKNQTGTITFHFV